MCRLDMKLESRRRIVLLYGECEARNSARFMAVSIRYIRRGELTQCVIATLFL